MPNDISRQVEDLCNQGALVIQSFRSKSELLAEVSTALSEDRSVLFMPGHRSIRHFFNTSGFLAAMEEITRELRDFEVIIPAGLYDNQHIVAFGPVRSVQED